jgi:purine-binding chemotaxis protein CheW
MKKDNSFITFNLHGMLFAIDTADVVGIIWLPELTMIEEYSPGIAGLINLHGKIVPVMDLLIRFGHNPRRYNCTDKVIILSFPWSETENNNQKAISDDPGASVDLIGIIAGEVMDVLNIPEKDIELSTLETGGENSRPRFVGSKAKSGEDIFMILDPLILFNHEIMNDELHPEEIGKMPKNLSGYFCPEADPEERAEFHNRAIDLQQVPLEDDSEILKPVAVISLNNEYLCVELEAVREFSKIHNFTQVPCCPDHITGNMNLRGDVLTIIDICGLLNLKACRITELTKVIVADSGEFPVGVIADDILDVIYIKAGDILPVPHSMKKLNEEFVKGAVPYGSRMMAILDMKEILSSELLIVNEEVLGLEIRKG